MTAPDFIEVVDTRDIGAAAARMKEAGAKWIEVHRRPARGKGWSHKVADLHGWLVKPDPDA